MSRYLGALRLRTWLVGALIAATVAGGAVGVTAAASDPGLQTAVVLYQDTETEAGTENPSDDPLVFDNPVQEEPLDLDQLIAMWTVVLGFGSTFAISLINRFLPGIGPDDSLKRGAVAFVFCLGVGVVDTLIRGVLNPANLTATTLLVFTSAIAFYNLWFRPTGMAAKIETSR